MLIEDLYMKLNYLLSEWLQSIFIIVINPDYLESTALISLNYYFFVLFLF